jgi:para-nitrobenzyl esterase
MKFTFTFLPLLISCLVLTAQTANDSTTAVVSTEAGKVRGRIINDVIVFKSIPYAAAPVESLRFAAPAPHPRWDGVREFVDAAPTAPFNLPKPGDIDDYAGMGKGWVKGNDYLTVNIWKPQTAEGPLPVMVFIHGGAFVIGTSTVALYDGAAFAKKGVILVTLNYRMGIEGFLKIEGVPTNLGIRDQVAALQWVKNNINAFGGDPAQVTVFGESAGAMSVGVLMLCPAAKNLFKRAIMMSGSGQSVFSGEQADKIATAYASKMKIKNTRDAWMQVTPEQLLQLQPQVSPKKLKLASDEYPDPTGGVLTFFPVVDGDIVPAVPLKQMQQFPDGRELLIGFNTDEANYFLIPIGALKKIKLEFILKIAVKGMHPSPSKLIDVYRKKYPSKKRGELFSSMFTAYQFKVPSIRFADAHATAGTTYMYEFGWKSSLKGGSYGAYHGIALPFVFNTLDSVKGERGMVGPAPVDPALGNKIQDAFIQFAKTGNPGWDAYTKQQQQTMYINNEWQLQRDPYKDELPVWEGVR